MAGRISAHISPAPDRAQAVSPSSRIIPAIITVYAPSPAMPNSPIIYRRLIIIPFLIDGSILPPRLCRLSFILLPFIRISASNGSQTASASAFILIVPSTHISACTSPKRGFTLALAFISTGHTSAAQSIIKIAANKKRTTFIALSIVCFGKNYEGFSSPPSTSMANAPYSGSSSMECNPNCRKKASVVPNIIGRPTESLRPSSRMSPSFNSWLTE